MSMSHVPGPDARDADHDDAVEPGDTDDQTGASTDRQRQGNVVDGAEQMPSGMRPGSGRDADDGDAGGVGRGY